MPRVEDPHAEQAMEELEDAVEEWGGDASMLDGWRTEVHDRPTGSSAGTTDRYYFDEFGKRFRSAEIAAPPGAPRGALASAPAPPRDRTYDARRRRGDADVAAVRVASPRGARRRRLAVAGATEPPEDDGLPEGLGDVNALLRVADFLGSFAPLLNADENADPAKTEKPPDKPGAPALGAEWRTEGPHVGMWITRAVYSNGKQTSSSVGLVEGYLPPEEADFLDDAGAPAALWSVRYAGKAKPKASAGGGRAPSKHPLPMAAIAMLAGDAVPLAVRQHNPKGGASRARYEGYKSATNASSSGPDGEPIEWHTHEHVVAVAVTGPAAGRKAAAAARASPRARRPEPARTPEPAPEPADAAASRRGGPTGLPRTRSAARACARGEGGLLP
ncbi:potassium:proton antiporter [Aureococcus anophagefferens]|nr:potassium:proton antiporter [Aureococcus anophagefferens]